MNSVIAFDEDLARRVRAILSDEGTLNEKRMFGGLAFIRRGLRFVSSLPAK